MCRCWTWKPWINLGTGRYMVGCSGYTGEGLLEGFDWLVQDIASRIYILINDCYAIIHEMVQTLKSILKPNMLSLDDSIHCINEMIQTGFFFSFSFKFIKWSQDPRHAHKVINTYYHETLRAKMSISKPQISWSLLCYVTATRIFVLNSERIFVIS